MMMMSSLGIPQGISIFDHFGVPHGIPTTWQTMMPSRNQDSSERTPNWPWAILALPESYMNDKFMSNWSQDGSKRAQNWPWARPKWQKRLLTIHRGPHMAPKAKKSRREQPFWAISGSPARPKNRKKPDDPLKSKRQRAHFHQFVYQSRCSSIFLVGRDSIFNRKSMFFVM